MTRLDKFRAINPDMVIKTVHDPEFEKLETSYCKYPLLINTSLPLIQSSSEKS